MRSSMFSPGSHTFLTVAGICGRASPCQWTGSSLSSIAPSVLDLQIMTLGPRSDEASETTAHIHIHIPIIVRTQWLISDSKNTKIFGILSPATAGGAYMPN